MALALRKFWRSLKRHPGVYPATAITFLGIVSGGWVGAAIMGVYWVPVFLTAWEMRHDG